MRLPATLFIFGGLPGTGKTTLARLLANDIGALYLRIDAIEQAFRNSQTLGAPPEDGGYRVAYAVAADNLRLGQTVVADSVNPLRITRDAWRAVAADTNARVTEIEVICSDSIEHRRRVESRSTDIPGLLLPTWQEATAREYDPWDRPHIIVDTANISVDQSMDALRSMISSATV